MATARILSKEDRLRSAGQFLANCNDLPVFSRHLHAVVRLIDSETANPTRITPLVERSFALSAAVLRQANAMATQRQYRRVLSVEQAICMLGCVAVRDLASGLLSIEETPPCPRPLRELILKSTLTANLARQIAQRDHQELADEAYLSGMFRNLGELMVAAYLPLLHQEVQHRHTTDEPDLQRAASDVLCFSYEELGQRIALRWNMPDSLARAMSTAQPRPGRNPQLLLHGMASFAHGITDAMHHPVQSQIPARLEQVRLAHQEVSRLSSGQMTALMNASLAEVKEVWLAAAFPTDVAQLAFKVSHALDQASKLPPPVIAISTPAALPVSVVAPPEESSDEPPTPTAEPESPLVAWLATIRDSVTQGEESDVVVRRVLEALVSSGAQRAVLAVPDTNARLIYARVGVGEDISTFLRQFRYPADAHTNPVAFALARQKELYLDSGSESHAVFIQRMGLRGALIVPVLVDDQPQACIYADWKEGEGISAAERRYVRDLRDLAAESLAAHQQRPVLAV
ncbi:MAG: HDOD domain-containing protein [Acidobacteria bacterium]|nr:HDOD domain-containing protein [Acidobacteriota bacterium]